MSIVIVLPWPSAALNPNARGHWGKRSRAAKKARADAGWAAIKAGAKAIKCDAALLLTTFAPPTRGRYDDDNLQSRCKAYFDGIADAIGVDDSHFRHGPIQRSEPVKGGNVSIEIHPMSYVEQGGRRSG